MARQTPQQQKTVQRVMHAFKDGELEQRNGELVTNPRQAIAIALHEAGASNQETPQKNRENLARTTRGDKAARSAQRRGVDHLQVTAERRPVKPGLPSRPYPVSP